MYYSMLVTMLLQYTIRTQQQSLRELILQLHQLAKVLRSQPYNIDHVPVCRTFWGYANSPRYVKMVPCARVSQPTVVSNTVALYVLYTFFVSFVYGVLLFTQQGASMGHYAPPRDLFVCASSRANISRLRVIGPTGSL